MAILDSLSQEYHSGGNSLLNKPELIHLDERFEGWERVNLSLCLSTLGRWATKRNVQSAEIMQMTQKSAARLVNEMLSWKKGWPKCQLCFDL